MSSELIRAVWRRADRRCEYCHMPEVYEAGMNVDHIVASKHGGTSDETNLALACSHCNRRKGPNIAGIDSESGELTRLFHPRREVLSENFEFHGVELHLNAADIRAGRGS